MMCSVSIPSWFVLGYFINVMHDQFGGDYMFGSGSSTGFK